MSYGTGDNPYDSPKNSGNFGGQGSSDPIIQGKVKGPATGLIVTAAIGIALNLYNLAQSLFFAGAAANQQLPPNLDPQMRKFFEQLMAAQGPLGAVFAIIGIVVGAVVLLGAMKMMKLEGYGFALTATILAMVPCLSPCCVLGLPIGIWSLVVLMNAEVKSAFH
ncbi:MAG: hypothetical protein K8T91_17115 [Planctomycetes bacterium]|nr:hypothetical protein [Planctomycetota bacterium]